MNPFSKRIHQIKNPDLDLPKGTRNPFLDLKSVFGFTERNTPQENNDLENDDLENDDLENDDLKKTAGRGCGGLIEVCEMPHPRTKPK